MKVDKRRASGVSHWWIGDWTPLDCKVLCIIKSFKVLLSEIEAKGKPLCLTSEWRDGLKVRIFLDELFVPLPLNYRVVPQSVPPRIADSPLLIRSLFANDHKHQCVTQLLGIGDCCRLWLVAYSKDTKKQTRRQGISLMRL